MTVSIYQDLYDHNDWANQKLFRLAESLTDEQLDLSREMGFGTLRNTCFHLLEAEAIWLERWQGKPWRPLKLDAEGRSIKEISTTLQSIAEDRNRLIEEESTNHFSRIVKFSDTKNHPYAFPIGDLLNHVSNHGIHHRAQVLSFLRTHGITVPAGVDYLFWKLAYPSCEQPESSVAPMRGYGLEVANGQGKTPKFCADTIKRYFQYHQWAMNRVFDATAELTDEQLDQSIEMGWGSLRNNLQHMINADRWWIELWKEDGSPFPSGEPDRSIQEMRQLFDDVFAQRNRFIDTLDEESANRVVTAAAGGPPTRFRVTESLLQLCGHGTHHRAQCLNMLRQLGVAPPGIDLVEMLRCEFRAQQAGAE